MPYESEAQRRYFNANRAKLESEGVDVDEWNASSKGKKLPKKKGKKKTAHAILDLMGHSRPTEEPLDKTAGSPAQRGQPTVYDWSDPDVWRAGDGQSVVQVDVGVPDMDVVGLIGVAKHAQVNPLWGGDVNLDKQSEALTPVTGLASAPQSPQLPQNTTPAARIQAAHQQALSNMWLRPPAGVQQQQLASATGPPTMNSTQNILSGSMQGLKVNEDTGKTTAPRECPPTDLRHRVG